MSGSIHDPAPRNLTLDFFRGVALLVIFINHVPDNELALFTPSRFGLSDAAEMFVFLSGYAAAIAYGRTFSAAGFALGSLRVFHRCGQIYVAHLALFGLMAMTCVVGNGLFETRDYITHLNIRYFFDETEQALRHLMALRYVPNYFDILPMYLVIMLWIPGLIAVARVHRMLALAVSVGVYLAMWSFDLEFQADPVGDRPWFFNPFGWQLIFFIGFGFGSRWLRCPLPSRWWVGVSVAIIVLSLPLSPEPGLRPTAWLQGLHAGLQPWLEKTRFGPLRLIHFLALAYLASVVVRGQDRWLEARPARLFVQMGQQSLPIFMISMMLSYVGGMVFDQIGHTLPSLAAVNLGGMAILMLCGSVIAWVKSSPWKRVGGTGFARVHAVGGVLTDSAPFPWRRWLEGGAAVTLALVVSAGPVLLSGRRSVEAPKSDAIGSGNIWVAARVWLDDADALRLPVAER